MGYYATGFLEMLSSFEFVLFLFLLVIISLSIFPWRKSKWNFLKSIIAAGILTIIISTIIDYVGFGLYGKYKEEMVFVMGFILLLLFLYIIKKKLR